MTQPVHNPTAAEVQGFRKVETISIDARRWQALRRQMVRIVLGWRYADKEIDRILENCKHTDGCPAVGDNAVPCLASCPDRETWLSALVIKHNASNYAMYQQGLPLRPDGEYHVPSREFFDAVLSELEVLREGKDILDEIAATGSWNEGPQTAQPMEKPVARLLPPEPEPEPKDSGEINLADDDENENEEEVEKT